MTLRTLCIVAVAGLLFTTVPCVPDLAWAETAQEQAGRQLEFARTELEAGRMDRAIKSAESALRLDPAQYEAIVIKALAFEALSDLNRAEALLLAYLDFIGEQQPDPRVGEALKRLAADTRRARQGSREGDAPPMIEQHQAATQALIAVGRCAEALVPAQDFVKANPKDPRAHGVLGDVYRCAVQSRRAGLEYKQAISLGSEDRGLRKNLKNVEAQLATLVIELEGASIKGIQVRVTLGTAAVSPTSFVRSTARFDLMPPGAPLHVTIGGRGFKPQALTVPALDRAEVREVKVAPTYVGVGSVSVADWPAGGIQRVEIMDGRTAVLAAPGQSISLEAGTTTARITNQIGTMEVPLTIANGTEITFEPGRWMPAGLIIHGLPTGSTAEVKLGERSEEWISLQVPPGDGVLDPGTGAMLAAPQSVAGLVAGRTTLRVNHPTLGVGAQAITLNAAQSNEVTFDQAQLPGTAALTKTYKEFKARSGRPKLSVPALGAAIGGGVAFALTGVFAGVSADSATKEQAKYDTYFAATGTGADTTELYNAFQAQRNTTRGGRAAAGIFAGIGVIGVGVSIPLAVFLKPKPKAGDTGPVWAPEGF